MICTDFLQDMINSNPNILSEQSFDLPSINTDILKTTPLEKMTKEDKIKLVEHLLKLIQPYLSAYNLSVEPPEIKLPPVKGAAKASGSKKAMYLKGFP